MEVIKVIGMIMGLVFPAWPILVAAPLGWRKGNTLTQMFQMWVFLLLGWLLSLLVPPIPSYLIPEPANTISFFVGGVALFAILQARKNN